MRWYTITYDLHFTLWQRIKFLFVGDLTVKAKVVQEPSELTIGVVVKGEEFSPNKQLIGTLGA